MNSVTTQPTVTIRAAAAAASLRYLRVAAAAVADDAGFDVSRIDAARLAVDELCALAFDTADDAATIEVSFHLADGAFEVIGTTVPATTDPLVDSIAASLLDSFGFDYEISRDGDACHFRLRCEH